MNPSGKSMKIQWILVNMNTSLHGMPIVCPNWEGCSAAPQRSLCDGELRLGQLAAASLKWRRFKRSPAVDPAAHKRERARCILCGLDVVYSADAFRLDFQNHWNWKKGGRRGGAVLPFYTHKREIFVILKTNEAMRQKCFAESVWNKMTQISISKKTLKIIDKELTVFWLLAVKNSNRAKSTMNPCLGTLDPQGDLEPLLGTSEWLRNLLEPLLGIPRNPHLESPNLCLEEILRTLESYILY